MHLCVSHLVVVVIFMIFILLTFLLSPTTVVPPSPCPHCLCMLLVVLSHSFYVLFSATLLLLCHFTFVTRPSPSSFPHPLPSAVALLLILFYFVCGFLVALSSFIFYVLSFAARAQLTLIGCVHSIVPASACPPSSSCCLV